MLMAASEANNRASRGKKSLEIQCICTCLLKNHYRDNLSFDPNDVDKRQFLAQNNLLNFPASIGIQPSSNSFFIFRALNASKGYIL